MAEKTVTVESLRAALRSEPSHEALSDETRFQVAARRYESALTELVAMVHRVVKQVPELRCVLEDEVETFTSPAFPGKAMQIEDQRVRIFHGESLLLFDPTAKAHLSALGQVEVQASRPIPFLVEKVLYLLPDRPEKSGYWGFRSVEHRRGSLTPFTEEVLLRMLACVFAPEAG